MVGRVVVTHLGFKGDIDVLQLTIDTRTLEWRPSTIWACPGIGIIAHPENQVNRRDENVDHTYITVIEEYCHPPRPAVKQIILPPDLPDKLRQRLAALLNVDHCVFVITLAKVGNTATVALYLGPGTHIPVYAAYKGGVARLSYDFNDVIPFSTNHLDAPYLSSYLTGWDTLSSRTVCTDIIRILPGSFALISKHGVEARNIAYVPLDIQNRALQLSEAIQTAIQRRLPPKLDMLAVEVSGGMDSALVAMEARKISEIEIITGGLAMPPPTGSSQQLRRSAIVDLVGATDETIPLDVSGLGTLSANSQLFHDDFSFNASDSLARSLSNRGARIVATGCGADEIIHAELRIARMLEPFFVSEKSLIFFDEAYDLASTHRFCASWLSRASPALGVTAAKAALYFRNGTRPIHPFLDTNVAACIATAGESQLKRKSIIRQCLRQTSSEIASMFDVGYEREDALTAQVEFIKRNGNDALETLRSCEAFSALRLVNFDRAARILAEIEPVPEMFCRILSLDRITNLGSFVRKWGRIPA